MSKKSNRYLYKSDIKSFLKSDPLYILGILHNSYHGTALTTTDEAWFEEIQILQNTLIPWEKENAEIIFEYDIPRMGKRIDVVLLLKGIIFCLEFKIGKKEALQSEVEQVMDYALDLKNFHLFSHDKYIVPILIPTNRESSSKVFHPSVYNDSIVNPLISGKENLQLLIKGILSYLKADTNDNIKDWVISPYSPTPTIIEAAKALYENHSVEEITRHEADKVITDSTIAYIQEIIKTSKRKGQKSICFVTGVPGAGKTLVGLEVAVKQSFTNEGEINEEDGAVYLSGNGPLVSVLTEALARDNYKKTKLKGIKKNLSDSRREVGKFIQIIHRYRDNMLAKIKNPVIGGKLEIDPEKAFKLKNSGYGEVEHIAIFDEAQRAWNHKRIANYLKRGGTYGNKLKVENFPMSEAAFLIWSLDQREDWATIICLIGGGQEINTGEAGITEWINAINERFPHWNVYISDKLSDPEYAEGKVNELLKYNEKVEYSDKLHLGVSLRSFRSEKLSSFVHSLLSFKTNTSDLYKEVINNGYKIVLTRNMDKAREWLRKQVRGTQQSGILITKVSARYKPMAVHVLPQDEDNAIHWFLEDRTDIRSSNRLEEAATEIQVQGLEVDFSCVLWDADMRYENNKWNFWKFSSSVQWSPNQLNIPRWIRENNPETQKYMLNAYRVLLTRARQGMVICVPEGNSIITAEGFPDDSTRLPSYYDSTYNYFKSLGIEEL